MRKSALVVVISVLMVALPFTLWAQGPAKPVMKPSYVAFKGGVYMPESQDLKTQDAGDGFAGRVAFGYYLAPFFSVEAALGYQDFNAGKNGIDRKYQMYPLEAAGRLGLPLGIIEPYLIFGLGGYYITAKAQNLTESSYRMGFFGGGGMNVNLGSTVFIGMEARYMVLQASTPYVTTYNYYYHVGSADVNLDGVMVTGNIGFRF